MNLLYKELGNSIYGNIVKGMSQKRVFDIRIKGMSSVKASEISNPILASYITGSVRAVISEMLHCIQLLENEHSVATRVISVTTDGFVTNVEKVEEKVKNLPEKNRKMLECYQDFRKKLNFETKAYEEKSSGEGIVTWSTRGQIGIRSKIQAATGFQTGTYEKGVLVENFINILGKENKSFEYIQQTLRKGNEIYKKGGHVVMTYKDRLYNLNYDNKRNIKDTFDSEHFDHSTVLLESEAYNTAEECKKIRATSKIFTQNKYNKIHNESKVKYYTSAKSTGVRTFLKGLLAEEPLFGLPKNAFGEYKEIIEYIKEYDRSLNISTKSISNLKTRKLVFKPVDKT